MPYKLSSKLNQIENFIWHDYSMISKYYGAVTIHDRFHFLFTLGAVIRSESIFKADLSDLVGFAFNQEKEPDPYHVLVM